MGVMAAFSMPAKGRCCPLWMRLLVVAGLHLGLAALGAPSALANTTAGPQAGLLQSWNGVLPQSRGRWTPVDHKAFKELAGPFKTPEAVTRACIGCHTQAARQVKTTIHWTWSKRDPATGRMVGKKNVFNTFCANITSNEQFCTMCHVGYGDTDPNKFVPFEARADDHVDCLVCHEQTGDYHKIPFLGGNPAPRHMMVRPGCAEFYGTDKAYVDPPDLAKFAQSVTAPSRQNCGGCHFYGGGGDGVKHGDLDTSLIAPSHALDVHMDVKGLNFTCETCHITSDHALTGGHYHLDAKPENITYQRGNPHGGDPVACRSCHGDAPHKGRDFSPTLNMHTASLACQTCHIPEFARGKVPTKMTWDYASAGKFAPNGTPLTIDDKRGDNLYWGVKGDFTWGRNVVPAYRWFNGTERWMNMGDKLAPGADGVAEVNSIEGSPTDGKSRIWPFKIMKNNQPYDTVNNTLAVFHSFGLDDDAFAMSGNWQKAIAAGMKAAGLPYSGQYGFMHTRMYWPITHMVAPAKDAVPCGQCHTGNGRLAGVPGLYLPGRGSDHLPWLETLGKLAVLLSLIGVLGHAGIRILLWLRRRGGKR